MSQQQQQQQQQYFSKQRLIQQQQQQQRAWHYENANNDMNMFAGTGNRNIPVRNNIGYDLEMGGGTSAYYGGFTSNQLQRQQQQQHAMHIARRHQQKIAQQQQLQQQQQQYSQNYHQHEQQQRLMQHQQQQQQHQQQQQNQFYSQIKSEPIDDAIEQMLTPTIEMEELIIKSEPPDEQAYNNFLRQNHQQKQQQHTLPNMSFKTSMPSSSSSSSSSSNALVKPISTSSQPIASTSINPDLQQFYPQVSFKEEFPRPTEQQQQQKPPNFPRLKVQTERSGTLPICQRCKQVFLKKHSYVQHVAQSICDIVEYDFKCDVCSMSFMSSEELTTHEKLHRQNKFFCHKYCGKHFDSIEACELHEFQHHEYATYVCNICSATFPNRELLFAHMPQHRQQPRFDCSVCRLWFQTPLELHQHRIASPYFCGKFYDGNARSIDYRPPVMHASPSQMAIQRPQFSSPDSRAINQNNSQVGQGMSRRYFPAIPSGTHLSSSSSTSSHNNRVFPPERFVLNPMTNRNPSMLPQQSSSSMQRMKADVKIEPDHLFPPNEYLSRSTAHALNQQQQQRFTNDFNDDSFASGSSSNASRSFGNEFGNFGTNTNLQISRPEVVDDSEDAVCCVQKCGTRKRACPSLQYFRFPRDEKYLHQWLHNLKMLRHPPDLNFDSLRICSLHFPKRCINRYSLCYWAVPTFNLGHEEVANIYQNREITNTFTTGENARCSMPGCNSQRGESNMKFYNFPKEVKMLIKWCQNARLPVHTKEPRHFCSRHFEERCFGKFRLKPWAVPTLHLGTPYGRIHDNPSVLILEEKKCCLPHCKRARSSDFNLSLYRFPRDETLLRRWCYNLRLDPDVYRGKNHKICSNHFIKEVLGLRKLSPGAVPTLNLGHNDTFNFYENELYTAPAPPPPAATTPKVFTFHNANMSASSSISSSVSHYASASLSSSPTNFSPLSTPINATTNLMDFADYCLVSGCTSTRTTEGVTLHTIPRRHEQMLKWCHNLKMEPSQIHKGLRICNLHFEPFCIGGCMRPFAVPTLNLGHDDPNIHKNPDVIKKLNIRETCCVQICKRNRDRDRANLHRFPSKTDMLEKWCANLNKPLPDGTRLFNDAICEVHFEERCLRNKRIEKWAVPTLNLGHNNIVHHLPTEEEVAEMVARQNLPTANTGDEDGICCVETCKRNPEVDDIRLYRLPDNPEMLAKWAHNLQMELDELRSVRICNLHFEPRCIGKKLHTWAIPTMNLAKHVEPLYQNPSHNLMMYRKEKLLRQSFEVEKPVDEFGEPLPKATWAPRCCLPHCRNKRGVNNVQLFRIPYSNRSMMAKWCHNLQIPLTQLKPRRICSVHFEPHVLTKRCPMSQAVPTLDLNTPPGYKIYQNPSRLKAVKMSAQTVCSVESCQKTRSEGVQLFRLPLKGAQLRKWAHNLRLWENNKMPNLTARAQMRVCSRHFEPHSFGAKRLVPSAIPTLNVGHDQLDDLFPNEAQPFSEIQCVVTGCNSIKDADNYVRLFKFPAEDEDLLWKWCNNLKMNPIDCVGVRICQRHFEEDCMGAKNLYKWAIPTLELGHKDSETELIPNPKPEERYTETIAKCIVPDCGKTRKFDEVQLNSFPKNPRAFRRWKHNLKLEYLDFKRRDHYKICTEHFEPICQGKNRLKHGAIPTLKLGHDETSDLYKVKAEDMQYVLFGKTVPIKQSNQTSDGNGEGNEDEGDDDIEMTNNGDNESIIPCMQETENKCCYPDCAASKTVLREIYELPKLETVLEVWCKVMNVDRECLSTQSKLCGLHFIDVYESSKDMLDAENGAAEVKTELEKVTLAYYRACNSLTIRSAHCSVPGCKISQLNSEYRLYTFPYNRDLIEKWTQNTRVEVDEHRRYLQKICGLHFEPYCLTDTQKLRPWAIPTLHLNHDGNKSPKELHQNPDLNSLERRMLGRITYKCCVSECGRERTDDNNVRLFNFPTDETLLDKWAHNLKLRREKCPLYKICDAHFEPHCMGQSRLRSWSIPTLNLGHNDCKVELYLNPTKAAEKFNYLKDATSTSLNEMEEADNRETVVNDESNSVSLTLANVKIKKSLHVLKCCLPRCRKSRLKHGVSLYSFPSGTVLFKKWCHNLQLATASVHKHTRVCNTHFQKRCFDDSKQLRSWALPTLHLGHEESLYQNPKAPPIQTPTTTSPSPSMCVLASCVNHNTLNKDVVLVRFPVEDELLLQKWCKNLKLNLTVQQATQKRLCLTQHFESECIQADGITLKVGAIPTLNLGFVETPPVNEDEQVSEASALKIKDADFDMQLVEDKVNNTTKFVSHERKPRAPNNVAAICCLKHCRKEKTAEQHLTTFGFPKDPHLLAKWCDNLLLEPENCIGRVCIEHFELRVLGNRRLKPGAVPTLNLGHSKPLKHKNGEKSSELLLPENSSTDFIEPHSTSDINKTSPKKSSKALTTVKPQKKLKLEIENAAVVETATADDEVDFYAEKLDHSVFRLCCLKHCRRRIREREKLTETPDNNGSSSGEKPLRLFKFPREPKILRRWSHNLRLPLKYCKAEKRKLRICAAHFEPDSYEDNNDLKPKAVPTLDLGYDAEQQGVKLFENRRLIKAEKPKFCCIKNCNNNAENTMKINIADDEEKLNTKDEQKSNANTVVEATNVKDKLFAFPKRGAILRKWAHNTQHDAYIAQQHDYHICAQHFEAKCFDDSNELKPNMVPTLKLNNIDDTINSLYTNDDDDLDSSVPVPPLSLNITINDNKSLQQQQQLQQQKQPVCCIPNCGGLKGQYIVNHFPFPTSEELRAKWCHNLRMNENDAQINNAHICSLHFKIGCISKRVLHKLAIPTENLGYEKDGGNDNSEIVKDKIDNEKSESTTEEPTLKLFENPVEVFENLCPAIIPRCCVKSCKKSHRHDGVRLFQFPKNRIHYLKWAHNLGVSTSLKAIQNYRVCNLHFEPNCMRSNRRLLPGAIPTLALGLDEATEFSDETTQKKRTLYENNTTKISGEVKSYRKRNHKLLKGSVKCAIKGCSMLRIPAIALISLPREDGALRDKWLTHITEENAVKPTGTVKLCALHFIHAFRKLCLSSTDNSMLKNDVKEQQNELSTLHSRYEQLIRSAYVKQLMCAVPGCNVTYTDNIIFHQFPKKQSLFEKWQHNTQITADRQRRYVHKVCSLHFEERCFGSKRLRGWAIPTINLPQRNNDTKLYENSPYEEDEVSKANISLVEEITTKTELCCISNCTSNDVKMKDESRLFAFPKIDWLLQKWCENTGKSIEMASKLWICERHFEPHAIGRTKLRPLAVPTLLLGNMEENCAPIHDNPKQINRYHAEEKESGEVKFVRANCCAIISCFTSGVRLYKYPTKGILLQKWAENCRHHAYQAARYNFRICGKHFAEDCFEANGRLRFGAVPTLHLRHENTTEDLSEENQQSLGALHASEFLVRKRKKKFKQKCGPQFKHSLSNIPQNIPKKCGVPNCGRNKQDDGVRLYKFPIEGELLAQWCHNLHLKPNECKDLLICNMHFESRCINKRGVFKRAVPTLLLGHSNIGGESLIENPDDFKQSQIYYHCCVTGCDSSRQLTDTGVDIVLSALPKCRTLFEKWAHNMNMEATNELWQNNYKKVCNRHFENFCYKHRRLRHGAIPTLNLGHDNLKNIYKITEEELTATTKQTKTLKRSNVRGDQEKQIDCDDEANIQLTTNTLSVTAMTELTNDNNQEKQIDCDDEENIQLTTNTLSVTAMTELTNDNNQEKQIDCDDEENIQLTTNTLSVTAMTELTNDSEDIPITSKRFKLMQDTEVVEVDHNLNINMKDVKKSNQDEDETSEHIENFAECFVTSNPEINTEDLIKIKDEPIEIYDDDDGNQTNDDNGNEINDNEAVNFNLNKTFDDYIKNDISGLSTSLITPPVGNSTGLLIVKAESLQQNMRQKEFSTMSSLIKQHESNDSSEIFCCITNCINASVNRKPFAILHKFPLQPSLFGKWRHNCQLDPRTEVSQRFLRICERHFESKCYRNGKLIDGVVPTLNLGDHLTTEIFQNTELFGRLCGNAVFVTSENYSIKNDAIKCCLPHCEKQQNGRDNVQLFKFPESPNVLDKWLHNLPISYDGKQPWKYLVCNEHFEKCCFKSVEPTESSKLKLHSWATPTLNLGDHAPFLLFTNQDTADSQDQYDNINNDMEMDEAGENSLLDPIYEKSLSATTKETIGASRTPTFMYEHALTGNGNGNQQYVSTSYKRCCVAHCRNSRTDTIKLFHFPANYEDACKWQHILGMELNERELRVKLVCSQHFEQQYVGQRRLCGRSVMPTLNLGGTAQVTPLIICSILGCRNTSHMTKVFTKFPDDPNIFKKWCKNLRIDPRNYVQGRYNICKEHFEPKAFVDGSDSLKSDAVPTLTLPDTQLKSCCASECCSNMAMYDFPRNPTLRSKWCQNLRIAKDSNVDELKVCRKHFHQHCIRNERLHPEAVPTLFLGRGITEIHQNFATYEQLTTASRAQIGTKLVTTHNEKYFRPIQVTNKPNNGNSNIDSNAIVYGVDDDDNGSSHIYHNTDKNDNCEADAYNDIEIYTSGEVNQTWKTN